MQKGIEGGHFGNFSGAGEVRRGQLRGTESLRREGNLVHEYLFTEHTCGTKTFIMTFEELI